MDLRLFSTDILEASESDLQRMLTLQTNFDEVEKIYMLALSEFYQKRQKELESFLLKLPQLLHPLFNIRLSIISGNIIESDILKQKERFMVSEISHIKMWTGELNFVVGMAFLKGKNKPTAKMHFHEAYLLFEDSGLKKKSTKCLLDFIVLRDQLNLKRVKIYDYIYIVQRAERVDDSESFVKAQIKIARELQKLGAFRASLVCIEKGVHTLEKTKVFQNYQELLFLRCKAFIALKNKEDAYIDYRRLMGCSGDQPKFLLTQLEKYFLGEIKACASHIESLWKNGPVDFNRQSSHRSFTKTEMRIIDSLKDSPKTKAELIYRVYGNNINLESAENRLKVSLSRLRRKIPNSILFSDNQYELTTNYSAKF